MVSSHLFMLFVGALAVFFTLPGPEMALILQTGSAHGFRPALATAGGLALARALHVTLSALGVAALLRSAPWLYDGVRLAGAVYLVHVAIRIVRTPLFGLASGNGVPVAPGVRASLLKGVVCSLLNPKSLLFCSVLLPQFIVPVPGTVAGQVVELGVSLVAVGLVFDVAFSFTAARVSRWFGRHPRAQTLQRWTFGTLLFAFACRLTLD
jgi:threonine/homoserine/homoserine lactone efflux protein